jgi:hypothetical protein
VPCKNPRIRKQRDLKERTFIFKWYGSFENNYSKRCTSIFHARTGIVEK